MTTGGRTGEAFAKCARRMAFEKLKARQNEFASHLIADGLHESICESDYAVCSVIGRQFFGNKSAISRSLVVGSRVSASEQLDWSAR